MQKNSPLYHSVKEDIKKKINTREFEAGEVLPTEAVLCQMYQVSRVTVRKAINELVGEGFLVRDFGKRAVVRDTPVSRDSNRLSSLQEELEKAGCKCSSYVLRSGIMAGTGVIAGAMGLSEGEQVLYIERLRYSNGVPLCYQQLYLNYGLCRQLDVSRLASHSLYTTLERELGLTIARATQTIQATLSSYRIAALLELPDQVSMLKINRTAYTDKDVCFEYSETQYVSSRYHLSMTLWR